MIKKLSLLFLLFLSVNTFISAQRSGRQDAKIGLSYARFSTLPANSTNVYLEYAREFSEPFFLGFSGNVSFFNSTLGNLPVQTDFLSAAFDLNIFYALLRNERNPLRAGAALSARYFSESFDLDSNPTFVASSLKVGPAIKIHYDGLINDFWIVGVHGAAQFYEKGNSVLIAGAHVGIKF